MSGDNPRLQELRRRVHADPASMAFAQLAEECRRAGDADEAVRICRAGLLSHPAYLTARITLGRALTELGRLDEAQTELQLVLANAPDNLAATRAMAEIHQQRGHLTEALAYYKKAMQLARFDPELQSAVTRIEHAVAPAAPEPVEQTPTSIENLFDFDTLLAQLGGSTQPAPENPGPSATAIPGAPAVPIVDPLAGVTLRADDDDPLARLERQLRENHEQRPYEAPIQPAEREHAQRVLSELEDWLLAIERARDRSARA